MHHHMKKYEVMKKIPIAHDELLPFLTKKKIFCVELDFLYMKKNIHEIQKQNILPYLIFVFDFKTGEEMKLHSILKFELTMTAKL